MSEYELFLENLKRILTNRPDAPRYLHTLNKGVIRRVRYADIVLVEQLKGCLK